MRHDENIRALWVRSDCGITAINRVRNAGKRKKKDAGENACGSLRHLLRLQGLLVASVVIAVADATHFALDVQVRFSHGFEVEFGVAIVAALHFIA